MNWVDQCDLIMGRNKTGQLGQTSLGYQSRYQSDKSVLSHVEELSGDFTI